MFKRSIAASILVAAPISAAAQETIVLDEIIVSGGLTPIEADAYGRASSVVTAEEIERRQLRDASEILRALPGVAVSRAGGPGGLTQIRIRGAEANHVLVLVDGVEVSAPQTGEFDFSGLLAADIERVEVLRGPQSALYGSNATAGVIAITTKRGSRSSFNYGAVIEGGTNASADVTAYVRGGNETTDASLSIAARRDGGFDVSDDPNGRDDEDENLTINARFNSDIADDMRLGGSFRFTTRESDADQFNFGAANQNALVTEANDYLQQREVFGSAFAEFDALGGRVAHGPRFEYSNVKTESFTGGAAATANRGDRLKLSYQAAFALDGAQLSATDHQLTLLGEYERESFRNTNPALVFDASQLATQNRNLFGVAAEYRGSFFDRLDVQIGARHDFNDRFDDATTFSAGLSYQIIETNTRLHASVGTGVTNPTFFEQFGFIPASFIGDPSLRPEESFGWDIGIEQTFWDGRGVLDVTYFNEELTDEIITVFGGPPNFLSSPANSAGSSDRQGIEVALTLTPFEGVDVQASYTYTDSEDAAGLREVRRPKHEGAVRASYSFMDGRATIGGDVRFVLDNVDSDFTAPSSGAQQVKLEDYAIFGVHGAYQFSETAQVFGRIENLTDRNYAEVDGFATRGVTAFAGLRLTF